MSDSSKFMIWSIQCNSVGSAVVGECVGMNVGDLVGDVEGATVG